MKIPKKGLNITFKKLLHKNLFITIKVFDTLIGDGIHSYQCYFHLAPNITPKITDTTVELSSLKSSMKIVFEPTLSVDVVDGWFAPDYGTWIKAPVLVFKGRSNLPTKLSWKLFELKDK